MKIQTKKIHKDSSNLTEILSVYFLIFFLWAGYRLLFRFPEWIDEYIAKPLIWIVPLMALRKRIISNTVKSSNINISYNILLGLSVGILYFIVYTFLTRGPFAVLIFQLSHYPLAELIIPLFISLCTGFTEELVFRRYILENALSIFNDSILANIFSSFLFTLIHLPIIVFIYKYPLAETVSYLSVLMLSSLIYGWVYLQKRSHIASSLTHAMWNFLGVMIH